VCSREALEHADAAAGKNSDSDVYAIDGRSRAFNFSYWFQAVEEKESTAADGESANMSLPHARHSQCPNSPATGHMPPRSVHHRERPHTTK